MKRIVVLIDGTWNKEGTGADTNVAKLDSGKKVITQAFIKANAAGDIAQHIHYHDGVGNDGDLTQRLLGGAIGLGLKKIIQDVYEFLVSDYAAGDEIYIFGFSRGAYAARALAGLIGASGIQRQKNRDEFEVAWDHYRVAPSVRQQPQTASAGDRKTLDAYDTLVQRETFHDTRAIKCVAVWDTVGSYGIPAGIGLAPLARYFTLVTLGFHDTSFGEHVEVGLHAVAVDEHRRPFVPTFWTIAKGQQPKGHVEQTWFAGAHCNVGGGYPGSGLSDQALIWMIGRVQALTNLEFDIGKNSFHVVGLDDRGAIVLRQKWSRGQIEARLANMPPCLIGMEACVGAHHLSRKLKALGHDARLMPAKYVRPYSKGQKNDFRDAEAIAEAVQRPTMKFVATKTADQLDLQALHRVRERLVSQRTGIINQIRAFLLERGVAVRRGLRFLRAELPRILATPPEVLSARMVRVISDLAEDWRRLDERIDQLSTEIAVLARQDAGCERLMSVPGIGPIISSAMVAAIGTGDAFAKGRDFAAWLGLVPKQMSTGDRTILGKISKRGNRYLRVLFVQAAWVVLIKPMSWERHGLRHWIEAAKKRLHRNVLAIALANKLARIAWGVLVGSRAFEASKLQAA